ncbi:MAG: dihydrodipicolinate synthase family protein [Phycisphaerae bacterium]|nr:dihydrodipicolinate synthase family protein [Phycisphaerae bacterium]
MLHGVIVPVITPVASGDRVDGPAFRKVLNRLIEAGVHGIFVGGSAGEGPLLTDRQWRRMIEVAVEAVAGRVPLLGGAMDTSARRVADKVRTLRDAGYRHVVVTPSYYITVKTASEHLRLFGEAREAAGDMELIAYNIPGCTNSIVAVDTLCEMARRGWIRTCKESSGDRAYLLDLIRRGRDAGLNVLAGDEALIDRALLAGAKGIVPVCANYDPALYIRLYRAGVKGDRKALAVGMTRAMHLRDLLPLSGPNWIAGIKYALSALGLGAGNPVSPLEPVDPARKARIDALVAADAQVCVVGRSRR